MMHWISNCNAFGIRFVAQQRASIPKEDGSRRQCFPAPPEQWPVGREPIPVNQPLPGHGHRHHHPVPRHRFFGIPPRMSIMAAQSLVPGLEGGPVVQCSKREAYEVTQG